VAPLEIALRLDAALLFGGLIIGRMSLEPFVTAAQWHTRETAAES
jgi:hypothetical protein